MCGHDVWIPRTDSSKAFLISYNIIMTISIYNYFSQQDVGASSNVLLHADIPVTADCNEAIKGVEVNEKKQICAGKRGYDSCNGDSGGPLVMG